jgi:DNA repair protein RadC
MTTDLTSTINPRSKIQAKRVNIVNVKLVKENSVLYKRKIGSPTDAVELIRDFIENSDREQLIVCCLDTKNQPTAIHTVSIGSLNSSIVHPREVFKAAILANASSIIIYHNHPSGDSSPSSEDINITTRLKESGKIIGIELLDHIIVGDNNFVSIKEKGII